MPECFSGSRRYEQSCSKSSGGTEIAKLSLFVVAEMTAMTAESSGERTGPPEVPLVTGQFKSSEPPGETAFTRQLFRDMRCTPGRP